MDLMSIRIKEMRKSKGLTQKELAEKLGLKDSAIAKYENGRVENIKREIIKEMARIFDCNPLWLMGVEGVSNTVPKYTPDIQEVIALYSKLNDEQKASVLNTMKLFCQLNCNN